MRLLLPPLLVVLAFGATILLEPLIKGTPAILGLDIQGYHAVNGLACGVSPDNPFYNAIWVGLNQPSRNYVAIYGIMTAYVLLFKRSQWLQLLTVGLLIAGLGYINNPITWHWAWGARPFTMTDACILHPEWKQVWSQYSSYPSGHARETAAELTALVGFWRGIWPLAVAYMLLLDFSRLYLGVHFPSDVLVGTILGWIIARIAFLSYTTYVAPLEQRARQWLRHRRTGGNAPLRARQAH